MRNKIGVIGAGLVGATAAFALSQSGLASEIVLIDANAQRAQGEALDIEHGAALAPPVLVRNGEYPDLADAHLVIIAAGANQKSGETRMDLAQKNLAVIDSIVPQVARYAPECVLLVVSNPVDVLTWRAAELAGFAEGRVLGSGTVLDTARLRTLLSRHTRVDPRNVHAYVLGEHGDSEVPAWSLTSIAGMNMEEYCRDCKGCGGHLAERMREQFDEEVRGAAYTIIAGKGATYYGVAAAIRRIAEAILRDERAILTVSVPIDGPYGLAGTCLSLPCIVGAQGVERILPVNLAETEIALLRHSAEIIRAQCGQTVLQPVSPF